MSEREISADGLYIAIAHGDAKHRAWLRAAVDAYFAGGPVPVCDAIAAADPPVARIRCGPNLACIMSSGECQRQGYCSGLQPPAQEATCPHAAPFRYCETCVVKPCPIGLDAKPPTLFGDTFKPTPAPAHAEPVREWTEIKPDLWRHADAPAATVQEDGPANNEKNGLDLICEGDALALVSIPRAVIRNLRANELAAERQAQSLRERLDELTFVDERGTAWTAPTGWAYMQACKLRDTLRDEAQSLREENERLRETIADYVKQYREDYAERDALRAELAEARAEIERLRDGMTRTNEAWGAAIARAEKAESERNAAQAALAESELECATLAAMILVHNNIHPNYRIAYSAAPSAELKRLRWVAEKNGRTPENAEKWDREVDAAIDHGSPLDAAPGAP